MDIEPLSHWVMLNDFNITFLHITTTTIFTIIFTSVLFLMSALISGAEVAFFSLSPKEISKIEETKTGVSLVVLRLINNPKQLLATILVSNNFINIGIVILSSYIINMVVDFNGSEVLKFLTQIIFITFSLLLFGEIIPKIYANQFPYKVVHFMAIPLKIATYIFKPIIYILIHSTRFIDKYIQKNDKFSIDDLSSALELTKDSLSEEESILKGIIEFGNTEVSEIMCPRVDVVSVDITSNFSKILQIIIDAGYSRIPVYAKSFDDIKGILYIKDLLPHIHKGENFRWQSLIRSTYFIPEKKKINDLLEDLQTNKIHMAIVVDEYGGTSGIITMEDIIEEIIGDISDEFDEDTINFSKIDENNYLFDGKIQLNDFYKILNIENNIFDEIKGDADTLAGLILEIKGEFPSLYDKIEYEQFVFSIEKLNKRRIVKIKTTINR